MLITMLSAMYVMVRVIESMGMRFARQQEPFPYMVSQPLPWQVHSVSHSRRSSKADEFGDLRRNSMGVFRRKFVSMAVASTTLAVPCPVVLRLQHQQRDELGPSPRWTPAQPC
ncbi:hypothetical protein LDENG_00211820 [Lucifuga dentata]|nr:hypothetical protein LDENG_00211820 [Lucifuga dentata]